MNYQLTIDEIIGPWGYSKQYVRNVMTSYKGKHIDVKISSLGGNLDHGLDIRQQFVDHGDVTVYLSGFVASAATVIAMGAKRIVMSKYAMFLVHKCSNFLDVWGSYNADQMQQLIDDLEANKKENDKIDVVLANLYADKCKKKVSDILAILKEGRWLTAQEALDYGFIDEIGEPDGKEQKLNFTAEMGAKFNALGISTLGLDITRTSDDEQPVKTSLLERIASALGIGNASEKSNQSPNPTMEKKDFKFNKVESLLNTGSITPDNDGKVTVTAEQFEAINNQLDKLDADAASHSAAIKAKDDEIAKLKEQVENLKKAPGAETNDIEDDAGEKEMSEAEIDKFINEIY